VALNARDTRRVSNFTLRFQLQRASEAEKAAGLPPAVAASAAVAAPALAAASAAVSVPAVAAVVPVKK
jgi:hypothetical protein